MTIQPIGPATRLSLNDQRSHWRVRARSACPRGHRDAGRRTTGRRTGGMPHSCCRKVRRFWRCFPSVRVARVRHDRLVNHCPIGQPERPGQPSGGAFLRWSQGSGCSDGAATDGLGPRGRQSGADRARLPARTSRFARRSHAVLRVRPAALIAALTGVAVLVRTAGCRASGCLQHPSHHAGSNGAAARPSAPWSPQASPQRCSREARHGE
jgi:hypothetical protein